MDNGKIKETVERCRANCVETSRVLNTAAKHYEAILNVLGHDGKLYDITFGPNQSNTIGVSKTRILELLWAEVDDVRDYLRRLNRENVTVSKGASAESMKGDGQ
jgi:hypothetical protein